MKEYVVESMSPVRKVRAARRQHKTRKWIVAISVLLLIAVIVTVVVAYPVKNEPEGLKTLKNHYLDVMKNLNSNMTRTQMAAQLNSTYNQTDLFDWLQSRLDFTQDLPGWFEDPITILNSGKGICVQFSIVYVSSCLALGYPSRLVVAADTASWDFIHAWAEDYYNGSWITVDPSDSLWNDPLRYQGWDWGKKIGSDVRIYAFEDGKVEEVTSTYGPH